MAAVLADTPSKQELDPMLLISNKVVVDLLGQCARAGELHHALDCGLSQEDVYAELQASITLNSDGQCKLKVGNDELEQWQVRRMALETLSFG
jgi:ornithine cyclodeaminase/alanine dehydrogenase-like protein (mu-crystallin family)